MTINRKYFIEMCKRRKKVFACATHNVRFECEFHTLNRWIYFCKCYAMQSVRFAQQYLAHFHNCHKDHKKPKNSFGPNEKCSRWKMPKFKWRPKNIVSKIQMWIKYRNSWNSSTFNCVAPWRLPLHKSTANKQRTNKESHRPWIALRISPDLLGLEHQNWHFPVKIRTCATPHIKPLNHRKMFVSSENRLKMFLFTWQRIERLNLFWRQTILNSTNQIANRRQDNLFVRFREPNF